MSAPAAPVEADAIERRYGAAAAVEWRTLLNHFELAEGFALVVLVVPDRDGARLCRAALEAWLAGRGQHLTAIEPASPEELHAAAATLFNLPDDPARRAIWLAAVPAPAARDAEAWDLAWRHALVGLNQQRNPLRRRFLLPLIVVGGAGLVPAMREIAADLWSVRALSLRIEPGREALFPRHEPRREPERREPAPPTAGPDPDLALRRAAELRGRDGQQRTLAALLARAGQGFAARGQWPQAEAAWREAADLFERSGGEQAAGWTWVELGDRWWVTGRAEMAREAYAKALDISERLARAEPERADYQRDLVVSLVRQAQMTEGAAAGVYLQRALGIVEALQASGRLAPADAWMLQDLRLRLNAASSGPDANGGTSAG